MPYEGVTALPSSMRMYLPLRAQEIYWQAFNEAWEQETEQLAPSGGPGAILAAEEAAARSAWAAVRRTYRQDPVTKRWHTLSRAGLPV